MSKFFRLVLIMSIVLSTVGFVFRLSPLIKSLPFLSKNENPAKSQFSQTKDGNVNDRENSQLSVTEAYAQSTKTLKKGASSQNLTTMKDSSGASKEEAAGETKMDGGGSVSGGVSSTRGAPPECTGFIEKRERELSEKERALAEKEALLKSLQKDIEGKLARLEEIQRNIEAFRKEQERLKNEKIDSLVKIYGTMKPKEASKLLEKLDDDLVVNIISRMTTEQAAKIIANMDVKKAAEISQKLSKVKNSGAQ